MASYLKEEIKAGVIVVVSFLILSGSVILIGGTQFFEKLDNYYVEVMNAAGVEEGAPVKLGGVRVGKVLKVAVPTSPGKPIVLTIGIKKGTALYTGTKASIAQVGFVGDLYLLLSLEKKTGEKFKVGDTIPSEEQVQFGVLMARLDSISQTADLLLKDVSAIFSDDNKKEIKNILRNTNTAITTGTSSMDKVVATLKGTTAKLERVLGEVESLVGENKAEVAQLIKKARESIEKAGKMIESIEATAKSADNTMKTADRTIDLQSQNIDSLLSNLNRTTEDLRDVLHEVKSKPWSVVYKEGKGKEE
ncbi:MAG TPA: MlaD family protein [Thermodesulfovibrionales bacterium]|nr:MlaD family protein [Thermodesulfovibrionales bacterium]